MFPAPCAECHVKVLVWDLDPRLDLCETCMGYPDVVQKHELKRIVSDVVPPKEPEPDLHPLQKEFGFTEPEDGSEQRYIDRIARTPWGKHSVWWFIHNAIAHPLIAVLPFRPFFKFHDWTSRKLHGK